MKTTSRYITRPRALIAAWLTSMSLVSHAGDPSANESMPMPADIATHGQPMKMDETMPTQMKKEGMTKQAVMNGDKANRQFMGDKIKEEESKMKGR